MEVVFLKDQNLTDWNHSSVLKVKNCLCKR